MFLKLQVLGCINMLAKDCWGGDERSVSRLLLKNVHFLILVCRFVVFTLLNSLQQTPVSRRTLNPVYVARTPPRLTFPFISRSQIAWASSNRSCGTKTS